MRRYIITTSQHIGVEYPLDKPSPQRSSQAENKKLISENAGLSKICDQHDGPNSLLRK